MSRGLPVVVLTLLTTLTGCGPSVEDDAATRFLKRANVSVSPEVLDDYAGVYRLPSGALFRVFRQEGRLLAGTPPIELLPQTTREFASNQSPATIVFDRDKDHRVHRLNFRLANRDLWVPRVDDNAVDPTQKVDAGGHRLRMLITGRGSPTIVIEDGFGSSIEMRAELQAELSKLTRVVAYDHAGTGGSEAGQKPRDARQVAKELRAALHHAGLKPPFLLLGGSIGGDYMRVFAHEFPMETAGLVLLDPTPDWDALQEWMQANSPEQMASFQRMMGLADQAMMELMKHQEPGRSDEWAAIDATRAQARRAFPPSEIPLVQLTGGTGQKTHRMARAKIAFFDAWLKRNIPHARHVIAEESGHAIFATEPELVIREIHQLLQSLRQRQPK